MAEHKKSMYHSAISVTLMDDTALYSSARQLRVCSTHQSWSACLDSTSLLYDASSIHNTEITTKLLTQLGNQERQLLALHVVVA